MFLVRAAVSILLTIGVLLTSATPAIADNRLTRHTDSPQLGADVTVSITDIADGTAIHDDQADEPQIPASTMKLVTAANALTVFPPQHRFTTRTVVGHDGKSVAIVGGGDGMLTVDDIARLGRKTARALQRYAVTEIRVDWDLTLYSPHKNADGWEKGDMPLYTSAVSPLSLYRQRTSQPHAAAVRALVDTLQQSGIPARPGRAVTTSPQTATLASISPHTLEDTIRTMLVYSDNTIAEMLFRNITAATTPAKPADWDNSTDVAYWHLLTSGLNMWGVRLVDGSGLSARNRLPARFLTDILEKSFEPSSRWALLRDLMPAAGIEGTLSRRFAGAAACGQGRVWGKTGSLTGVNTLAGVARHPKRGWRAFAVMVNNQSSSGTSWAATSNAIDRLVAAAAGCR